MAARATVKPRKQQPETPHIEVRIRERAYQIYQGRGAEDGHALDDWLQAETEITHTVEQNYAHVPENSGASVGG